MTEFKLSEIKVVDFLKELKIQIETLDTKNPQDQVVRKVLGLIYNSLAKIYNDEAI